MRAVMNGARASLAHLYRRAGFGGRPDEIDTDPKVALDRSFPSLGFI